MNKELLQKRIAENRLEEVIRELLALTDGTYHHQEAVLLSARYAEYKKLQVIGTESQAELDWRRNQIAHALLQIVNDLPADAGASTPPPMPPTPPATGAADDRPAHPGGGNSGSGDRPASNMPFWFSIGAFIVLLAITLLAPGWAGHNNALFKTLLALAAAGVATTLPGFLHFEVNNLLKAGGALAAFVLVFLVNPAREEVPGSLAVQLRPLPPSGQYPPLKVMGLEIWNKNEWLRGKFSEEGVADFKNLSPEVIDQTVALRWKAEHYRPVRDSLSVTPPSVVLEWVPDGSLERVFGKITDPKGLPLPGVTVDVEGLLDTTDAQGSYELRIPLAAQKTHYLLNATAKGYKPKRPEVWPASGAMNFSMEK